MSALYHELAERFRGEVEDLDRTAQRALRAWERARSVTVDQDAYLDSVALNLHGFYSGLERLFELVARHVDGTLPAGATWHRDLLQVVSHEATDVRPAVIDAHIASNLDKFRRFRHLVRNIYTTNLQPGRMAGMLQTLPKLWPRLRAQLLAFAEFLEQLATADEVDDNDGQQDESGEALKP